jgi:hypothetical protein
MKGDNAIRPPRVSAAQMSGYVSPCLNADRIFISPLWSYCLHAEMSVASKSGGYLKEESTGPSRVDLPW